MHYAHHHEQAVFSFQLHRARTKAVHVVFGGGMSEFGTIKVCNLWVYLTNLCIRQVLWQAYIDLRVPVICVREAGERSVATPAETDFIPSVASLFVCGQRDLTVCYR